MPLSYLFESPSAPAELRQPYAGITALTERLRAPGPSPEELAAARQIQQAERRFYGQTAGMRGPQAAIASQRMQQAAPGFALQQAQAVAEARAAAEAQRRRELLAAYQAQAQAGQQVFAAEEAARQRRQEMIQGIISGGMQIGAAALGAG